jgi:Tetratricopeptide repeat
MNTGLSPVDALLGQAVTQYRSGRPAEAEKLYRQVLSLQPNSTQARAGLGIMLYLRGRPQEAIAAFRQAVELEPENSDLLYKLGNMLLRDGETSDTRVAESFACFARHARLTFKPATAPGELAHRIKHDREQQEYMSGHFGLKTWQYHLADGSRIASAAVNPDNTRPATEDWHNSHPQIIVVDNLLTPEALEKLRRFCWGSPIWRDTHPEGYLTAMPEHGLACPLIGQIDEEMRAAYPGILGTHQLRYLWAFKYDSKLSGVGTHADPSLVTFNFWITADEANLEPESGGLTVWDVAAPVDWKTQQYIGDTPGCQAFIKRVGGKAVTIPYRSNRAIVFSSALFHETDRMHFKEGYTNRRINITMLYGRR